MRLSLAEIETLDRAALSAAWEAVFGSPVPKRLSSPFLRRYLAFEMQARERGGLPKGFVGRLQKAGRDDRGTSSSALKPGGRLIYVTCSLLDAEGAGQVDAFLRRHADWRAKPVALPLGRERGQGIRLTPHHDGTDGFFIACITKP